MQARAQSPGLQLSCHPAFPLSIPLSSVLVAESLRARVSQEESLLGWSVVTLPLVTWTAKSESFTVALACNVIHGRGTPASSPLSIRTLQSPFFRSATLAMTLLLATPMIATFNRPRLYPQRQPPSLHSPHSRPGAPIPPTPLSHTSSSSPLPLISGMGSVKDMKPVLRPRTARRYGTYVDLCWLRHQKHGSFSDGSQCRA
jgi:hypothetical protein